MKSTKRLLALVLTVTMLCSMVTLPVSATEEPAKAVMFEEVDNRAVSAQLPLAEADEEAAAETLRGTVRVSILLEGDATIARYSTEDIAENGAAMAYRKRLQAQQETMAQTISRRALGGEKLDVVWNLTLATNMISANVDYSRIEAIQSIDGVAGVYIETQYDPMTTDQSQSEPQMVTSQQMIGSTAAYAAGLYGAGARIAVIDTGTDTDHQSFNSGAFLYALAQHGMANIDLLDSAEIAEKLGLLNISEKGATAENLYINEKLPFGYNYVDENYNITHDADTSGEHGSHVAGIATANAFIPEGDGYVSALDSVYVQGVAPDAQLLTMKVFGANGGAYDSDYMAAIEDAIVLGADAVNLSLGAGNLGSSNSSVEVYQAIMDALAESDTVVTVSAGNSGGWADAASTQGYLYGDDVSMLTGGNPGTFTNSLSVASAENDGQTGNFLTVGDHKIFYTESTGFTNESISTLAGQALEYVFIDGFGTEDEFDDIDYEYGLYDCVCVVGRGGGLTFAEKANRAAELGAAAILVYNNASGMITMDLTGYEYSVPCVLISQADAKIMKNSAEALTDYWGATVGYLGEVTIAEGVGSGSNGSEFYTMSDFSSWGIPGSLTLKPEITAPGGGIYSVNGAIPGGTAYETMSGTSMAAPQVAGMAALVSQHIKEAQLAQNGLSIRALSQSLLMSTATPLIDENSGSYYSVMQQGAGLANVGKAVQAESYLLMDSNATSSYADGKVKAELGDDPGKTGVYSFSFHINNLTDKTQSYTLSASLFTQALLTSENTIFLDTATTPLAFTAVWSVDDTPLDASGTPDFNGDGICDTNDCTAILEYVSGSRTALNTAEKADYDGDGSITSYDAYLFLQDAGLSLTVPANGSTAVSVTLSLTAAQKQALDERYPSGAYIEGYVFVNGTATDEGVLSVSHSIPVLAYYGDWSAPSMFEVGTYTEYAFGKEVRTPYLENENANAVTIKYSGKSGTYYFGGNPIVKDAAYDPMRNAINAENGDSLSSIRYTLIRNAAAGRIAIVKEGETAPVYEASASALDSAYYYENRSAWYNTSNTQSLSWNMAGAVEGERYTLRLDMATEYNVKPDGSVDWDELASGATLSIPFTIDNTAPTIQTVTEQDGLLQITAQDNLFIAAIAVSNSDGKQYAYTVCPQQTAASESVSVSFDGSILPDGVYLVQVYDYALNCTTYRVFVNTEMTDTVEGISLSHDTLRLLPNNTATLTASVLPLNVSDGSVTWSSSDPSVATVDANGVVTALAVGNCKITAASTLDSSVTAICTLTVFSIDKQLNAVIWDADETAYWAAFQTDDLSGYIPLTEAMQDDKIITATFGADGILYGASMDSTDTGVLSTLYTVDPDTFARTEIGACVDAFYADLAPSPTLDALLAVYGPYVLIVDPETGDYTGAFGLYSNTLVGIAYTGTFYSPANNCWLDNYLLIDRDGNVYRQNFALSNGQPAYTDTAETGLMFRMDTKVNSYDYGGSAYYDGEYLYWSVSDQDTNRAHLYAADVFARETYDLGAFADDVWPVGGLFELGKTNTPGKTNLTTATQGLLTEGYTTQPAQTDESPAGSLHSAVSIQGGAKRSGTEMTDNSTVVVDVTAQNELGLDISTYNGKLTVTYDSGLTLSSVTIPSDCYYACSEGEGTLTIAYAGTKLIPAGGAVARLTFTGDGDISVLHEQANDTVGSTYTETLSTIGEHLALVHTEAKAATCTAEGNIDYWYCETCHKYFADKACTEELDGLADTVLPIREHNVEDMYGNLLYVEAQEATCTMDGYTQDHYYCSICGKRFAIDEDEWTIEELETDSLILPALGGAHVPVIKNAVAATETSVGYTGDTYCARCNTLLQKGSVIGKLSSLTLDEVLNAYGGTLHFLTEDEHPWITVENSYEDYAVSTNEGMNETGSIRTQVHLEVGQAVTFWWKSTGMPYTDGAFFEVNGALQTVVYADEDAADYPEDWLEWHNYTYAPAIEGDYTLTWYFAHGEDAEEDGGRACLDEVEIIDADMAETTFVVGEHGSFSSENTSFIGTFDGEEFTVTAPENYRLQNNDVPAVQADEGYQFLGWFKEDTSEAVVPVGKRIEAYSLYTARFAPMQEGTATIVLETHNVFPDGTGYLMLLDNTHQAAKYFSSMNLVINVDTESWATHTLPAAKGSEISVQQVVDGTVAIQVPAGVYDWVICYPYAEGDLYLLTAMDLDYPTYRDDYTFAAGCTYSFTAYANADGRHDSVKLEITQEALPATEVRECAVRFVAGENGSIVGTSEYTAWTTTSLLPGKAPKVKPDEGYVFSGWEPAYVGGTTITEDMTFTARFAEAGIPATIILEARDVGTQAQEAYKQYYMNSGMTEEEAEMYSPWYPYDFAMLFDTDASVLTDGTLTVYSGGYSINIAEPSEDIAADVLNAFEYVLPDTFDGSFTSTALLRDGELSMELPAGTYDYVIASRMTYYAGTAYCSVGNYEGIGNGYATYTFDPGMTYRFTVTCELAEIDVGYGTMMEMPTVVVRMTAESSGCRHENLTYVPAKDATCTENGNIRYWSCPDCEKLFADEAATQEITETAVAALGHDMLVDKAVAATCTESGLTEGAHCSRCDYQVSQETTAPFGHSFAVVDEDYFCIYSACTRCGATKCEEKPACDGTGCLLDGYVDLNRTAWYHNAVEYVIHDGIMQGISNTPKRFAPESAMSRAMLVTVLYRLEGSPAVTADCAFVDVADGMWYTDAVTWATENGIVNGIGNNRFDPDGNVTREQAAVILYRYCGLYKLLDVSERTELSSFADASFVSGWAAEAMQWAVEEGLLQGRPSGSSCVLAPNDAASRAEIATILARLEKDIIAPVSHAN